MKFARVGFADGTIKSFYILPSMFDPFVYANDLAGTIMSQLTANGYDVRFVSIA